MKAMLRRISRNYINKVLTEKKIDMKKQIIFIASLLLMGHSNLFSQDNENPGNIIHLENAKPGTTDWILTNTYIDPDTWWRSPRIEGYCSEASVSAGDTLKIMVKIGRAHV